MALATEVRNTPSDERPAVGTATIVSTETVPPSYQWRPDPAIAGSGATALQPNLRLRDNYWTAQPEPGVQPAAQRIQRTNSTVDGAVIDVTENSVMLECMVGTKRIRIQLPRSLIAPELMVYGQPVRISLSRQGGIRLPRVEAREIVPQDPLAKEPDLERWLREP